MIIDSSLTSGFSLSISKYRFSFFSPKPNFRNEIIELHGIKEVGNGN
jgi:hypothetical protein